MTKKYLLAGMMLFAFALSACTRPYAGPEIAVTPSPQNAFADQKSATMDAVRTESALQDSPTQIVDLTAAASTFIATLSSTAITPVTQITFTSTPPIGDPLTVVPTNTPAAVCTPSACPAGQSLVCPSGNCPGGCGMVCAVVTATFTPLPVGARPATYSLQKYEHPYCIARRFNVNPDDLLGLSGISREQAYSLSTGTILTIPQNSVFPGDRALRPHPAGTTYTVTGNDDTTLYGVACMFGDVDPGTLATLNNLPLNAALTIGQVIKIQP